MINFTKIKPIIGILLIIFSIGGLLFWEMKGRDTFLMDTVIIANQDIEKGTKISKSLLSSMSVLNECQVKGIVKSSEVRKIYGKVANQRILKNSQISKEYLNRDDFHLKKGQSIYAIKQPWIAMRSSSLRRGDLAEIYINHDGIQQLGTYRIAFVKDNADREVKTVNENTGVRQNNTEILDREDSSSTIDHIEIICNVEQYETIQNQAQLLLEPSLIIVPKGGI